ncbi:hypothetical protein CY35_07G106600 [Sphagnum magellanicum]|uniref:Uncharacterized protein n=2 Tax=Sphagnum magellanicum TaxID=128215 RepID=A0ACB8HNN5_9BRYO|nr:hypothetical protein CY35_07G106600 [Sphagnum magellanicum]KAH9557855.1 hypothetical protein CY35_07G106600 [Sphagnum magellanicum]
MASSLLLPTASHIAALSSLHIHGFSTSRIQQQQPRFLRTTRVPLFHNAATPSFQEGRSNNASSKAAAARGGDDDDDDVDEAAAAALKQLESTSNSVLDFAAANFLPIALVTGVAIGLTFPQPGQLMQQWGVSKWTTSAIFVISGLTLSTGDVAKAAKAWPAVLFGLVSILFITPLMAVPVLRLNLVPRELVTGLAIFCCVPTTLTSGISLTQLAGANTALALALTVTSNLLGIFTMPYMLSALVGHGSGVSLPAGPLLKALVEILLIPLLIGKFIREIFNVQDFVDKRKQKLSFLSIFLLSLVPWMQTSCSRTMLLQLELTQLLAAIAIGICIHAVFLAWNAIVMMYLPAYGGVMVDDQTSAARAVIIVASQKTFPVVVAVVSKLGGAIGETGLLVLPCITYHLTQIMLDSMLVNFWLNYSKANKFSTS